jgi:hypothetical protein
VLGGQKRAFGIGLSDLLVTRALSVAGMPSTGSRSGPVDYVNVAAGPERSVACIQFGIVLVSGSDGKLAMLVRGADDRSGPMGAKVTLEVIAAEPEQATAFLARFRVLMAEHNVYRGQVVSLGRRQGPYATLAVEFHPRPEVGRADLVLADGVLGRIEDHILGIGAERVRLRDAGRHLKRGLLLHGPPGTGKTLTVRYLASRMADATVLILSGGALGLVGPTCARARTLTPALVVLEDVDLVAEERTMPGVGHNPLLFELLNEGMAEDADVSFLLTTNRPDILEPALAARPGRVDLAVQIDLPDAAGRRKLFELYGVGLDLRLDDVDALIQRTEAVSPAFIKELLRKAAMIAAGESTEGQLIVTDAHVNAALDELLAERVAHPPAARRSHGPTTPDDAAEHGLAAGGRSRRRSAARDGGRRPAPRR